MRFRSCYRHEAAVSKKAEEVESCCWFDRPRTALGWIFLMDENRFEQILRMICSAPMCTS